MKRDLKLRLTEWGLSLVLGIVLGLILGRFFTSWWPTLLIGFGIGSIISALSDHYTDLVKDIINWFRQAPKNQVAK